MFRYKLRTLLIVLALGPPLLAGVWLAWSDRQKAAVALDYTKTWDVVDFLNTFRTGCP